jgi:hypothetical protein
MLFGVSDYPQHSDCWMCSLSSYIHCYHHLPEQCPRTVRVHLARGRSGISTFSLMPLLWFLCLGLSWHSYKNVVFGADHDVQNDRDMKITSRTTCIPRTQWFTNQCVLDLRFTEPMICRFGSQLQCCMEPSLLRAK